MSEEAIIKEVYSRFKGTITQTYKRIRDDPKYHTEEMPVIRPKDVDYWFKHSHLTLDPKYHYESQFNSFVAPGPKHTIQVDLRLGSGWDSFHLSFCVVAALSWDLIVWIARRQKQLQQPSISE